MSRCLNLNECKCDLPKCDYCDNEAKWELKQISCFTIYNRYCDFHVPSDDNNENEDIS